MLIPHPIKLLYKLYVNNSCRNHTQLITRRSDKKLSCKSSSGSIRFSFPHPVLFSTNTRGDFDLYYSKDGTNNLEADVSATRNVNREPAVDDESSKDAD